MKQNLVGKKFGKLLLIEKLESYIDPKGKKISQYLCKCDCGGKIVKKGDKLKRPHSLHCGCEPSLKGRIKNGKTKKEIL
jgi:hypothetical protein